MPALKTPSSSYLWLYRVCTVLKSPRLQTSWIFSQNQFSVAEVSHMHKMHVSPQSRSLFSTSLQTFCLSACVYLNTQKYRLFCSLEKCLNFRGSPWKVLKFPLEFSKSPWILPQCGKIKLSSQAQIWVFLFSWMKSVSIPSACMPFYKKVD